MMASCNNDILTTICEYCNQTNTKKISILSKKHHNVAKYMLIYKFNENEFRYVNYNHYKLHFVCKNVLNVYLDRIYILDLSYSNLTLLPENIGELKFLQKLDVRFNQLTSLPESVCELKSLQKLDVSNNQLRSLPQSIGELKQLKKLYVPGNQLTSLP